VVTSLGIPRLHVYIGVTTTKIYKEFVYILCMQS
jgi:hypothetical protein